MFLILDLLIQLIDVNLFTVQKSVNVTESITLFIFVILLLINRTKLVVKKLFLILFFILTIFIWTSEYINLPIDYGFLTDFSSYNNFLTLNNLYLSNIIFLGSFEILFYLWSYISYKNNISNWIVPFPNKNNVFPIINILLFYLGMYIYYFSLV